MRRMMYVIVWQAIQMKDTEWSRLYERLVPLLCSYDERQQGYAGKGKVIGRIAGQITSVIYALLKKDHETLKSLAPGRVAPEPVLSIQGSTDSIVRDYITLPCPNELHQRSFNCS